MTCGWAGPPEKATLADSMPWIPLGLSACCIECEGGSQ